MMTSRITEGENRNFKITIMEMSICLSRALYPHIINFIYFLAALSEL